MATPAAPDLNIPASDATVSVSIIDTTAILKGVDAWKFVMPSVPGHEYLAVPCFSFLVQHPSGRRLVFDLGIRKDWQAYPPQLQRRFRDGGYSFDIRANVADLLTEHNIPLESVEAVIWSHWHFDHVGDPSTFPPSTALVVGPGFKSAKLPGYPADPDSTFLEADYAGRELREVAFPGTLRIGRFGALDYFGDGSFYLLDAPGHAVGHLCGLARVRPGAFVLMAGDAAHHGAEMRPSRYLPLPRAVAPHPFTDSAAEPWCCPGHALETMPAGRAYYSPSDKFGIHADVAEAARTIEKLQEADVAPNVMVVLSHDEHLLDVVDFFPATADDFMEKGWVDRSRWRFLKDLATLVGWEGPIANKREWAAPKASS